MDIFAPYSKKQTSFIVKNTSSQVKTIAIFGTNIYYGSTKDLLTIPGIAEQDIRASLLKGELNNKINSGDIIITFSDIDLTQFNTVQKSFLRAAGITQGLGIINELTQNVWYFDFINGNDNNDGLTATTAIKTWSCKPDGSVGEYLFRTGVNAYINQTINYYIMNDMPSTDSLTLYGSLGINGKVYIHGVPTVVHTGTLGTVTNRSPLSNIRDQLTDTDAAFNWTSYVGMMVEVETTSTLTEDGETVGGPTRGWIAKAQTSPNIADMSVMCSRNLNPTAIYQAEPGPFAAGNTYKILSLPSVSNLFIGNDIGENNISSANNRCIIELLNFPFINNTITYNAFIIADCSFDIFSGNGFPFILNPLARQIFSWSLPGINSYFGIAMPGCTVTGSGIWSAYGFMMQGPSTQMYLEGSSGSGNQSTVQNHHASFGLGIYDCDTAIIVGSSAVLSNESNIYGTGNTTCVVDIEQGGIVVDNDQYTVGRPTVVSTGTSDFKINGQTSLPAMNPTTYALSSPILLTFSNMGKTFASGGFQGIVFDPRSPMTRWEYHS